MKRARDIVVGLTALLHLYILHMEMFRWGTPAVNAAFGLHPEAASVMKPLAANQGLYNGFLAAGLIWGLVHPDARFKPQIQAFFLVCVAIAGVYGAATVKPSIALVQTLPAAIGLILVLLFGRSSTAK